MPHLVDGVHDHRGVVRDDPRFPHPDPQLVEPAGEKGEIGILRAP